MSLVFGIATLVFTIGMNISPWLYARISTGTSLVLAALLGGAGLFLSSQAQGFGMLMVGFGVLFGLGGGISMTTAQQIVNLSPVKNRGLMNGYIVSLLPLGAMIGGPLLSWSIEQDGVRHALLNMSVVILVTSVLAAWITGFKTIVKKQQADPGEQSINQSGATGIEPESPFWHRELGLYSLISPLVFFLAAAAGLMVLSPVCWNSAVLWGCQSAGRGSDLAHHRHDCCGAFVRWMDGGQVDGVTGDAGRTRLVTDRCDVVEYLAHPDHCRDWPDDGGDGIWIHFWILCGWRRHVLAQATVWPGVEPHLYWMVYCSA